MTFVEKSDKVSVRKKHLGLARVGNGRVLQAERTAWVLALREEDSEQKASQCDWNMGNKEWVMPGRGLWL